MATIIKQPQKSTRKPDTVRYRADGRQRERSFRTRQEATDFKATVEYQVRELAFADPRQERVPFLEYAAEVLANMDLAAASILAVIRNRAFRRYAVLS